VRVPKSAIGVSSEARTLHYPRSSHPERAASWSLTPADGAYATVVAWTSGAAWFDALMDALATPHGEECRRSVKVAGDTLLRVARADWLSADVDTGRGVSTAHETVALQLGMCKRTVQRSRELMELLGFAVTIQVGRYLTTAERAAAHQVHGGRQYRAASIRALTLPIPSPVENVHLPSPREGESLTPVLKSSPTRASARRSAAPRPQHGQKTVKKQNQDRRPRPLEDQRLAGELAARLPWLSPGRHVGTVSNFLARLHLSSHDWTAHGLLDALNRFCTETGVRMVDPQTHRDPAAYLAWLIKSATTAGVNPNRQRQAQDAERRAAERAARAEADRKEAERVAAIDWNEVARILEEDRKLYPRPIKPIRRQRASTR
jgi:hypothetical protein